MYVNTVHLDTSAARWVQHRALLNEQRANLTRCFEPQLPIQKITSVWIVLPRVGLDLLHFFLIPLMETYVILMADNRLDAIQLYLQVAPCQLDLD